MAANPKIAPQINPVSEKETIRLCQPKPVTLKQRIQNLLIEVFKGHEEFLGWTPD